MKARSQHDVAALAQKVEGLDAARYFDAQADEEYRVALTRWPVLARLMRLAPSAQSTQPVQPAQPAQPAVVREASEKIGNTEASERVL